MSGQELKKQTITYTSEGHAKLKELTKRHGVNQWMMIDTLIKTVDEENEDFLAGIKEQINTKEATKAEIRQTNAAMLEATKGLTPEEVVALIQKAKAL